jgi:hypothetical protein
MFYQTLYNKLDRLNIVLDISKKLRTFPLSNKFDTIDLYNFKCDAISEVKIIFNKYINQNDNEPNTLQEFRGEIDFYEIGRTIKYILPIQKNKNPLFVFKANKK